MAVAPPESERMRDNYSYHGLAPLVVPSSAVSARVHWSRRPSFVALVEAVKMAAHAETMEAITEDVESLGGSRSQTPLMPTPAAVAVTHGRAQVQQGAQIKHTHQPESRWTSPLGVNKVDWRRTTRRTTSTATIDSGSLRDLPANPSGASPLIGSAGSNRFRRQATRRVPRTAEQRRQRKLESNRRAARKFRNKKKSEVEQVHDYASNLERQNARIQRELDVIAEIRAASIPHAVMRLPALGDRLARPRVSSYAMATSPGPEKFWTRNISQGQSS